MEVAFGGRHGFGVETRQQGAECDTAATAATAAFYYDSTGRAAFYHSQYVFTIQLHINSMVFLTL
jgi:hypothetical protein